MYESEREKDRKRESVREREGENERERVCGGGHLIYGSTRFSAEFSAFGNSVEFCILFPPSSTLIFFPRSEESRSMNKYKLCFSCTFRAPMQTTDSHWTL